MTSPDYASHFSDRNIPFGTASSKVHGSPQGATRIENSVIFLNHLASAGLFCHIEQLPIDVFSYSTLNQFASLPKSVHAAVRETIQGIFRANGFEGFPEGSIEELDEVTMHLPVSIGDFAGTSSDSRI
jgi:fumarylacetoacetase